MAAAQPEPVEFSRRHEWSRAEWIVALDACPRDRQRYNANSRDVREVAYLIGRTPAAVSRAFANIWSALTGGREGLSNNSATCREVVAQFRDDSRALHQVAVKLRERFLKTSLAPRIEIHSDSGANLVGDDLRSLSYLISKETGVPRRLFVVYRREGSVVEGATLVLFGALTYPLGERFVRWVERHLKRRTSDHGLRIIRNASWIAVRDGKVADLETMVVRAYLPDIPSRDLTTNFRHGLADYLRATLGVRRTERRSGQLQERPLEAVPRRRIRHIESQLRTKVTSLSPSSLSELDRLLKVVDTDGFRRALAQARQTRLEDFDKRRGTRKTGK